MTNLQISDDLARLIQHEAARHDQPIEEFLKSVIDRERTLADRRQLEAEQEWWLGLPLRERAKYEGEYVAIHNRALVDHDKNEDELYQRIRAQYGRTPVLLMPAEGPREIRIYSPRFPR